MTNPDTIAEIERTIADAIEDARDGTLGPDRREAVRELLRTSPEARRYYLRANVLDHRLAACSARPDDLASVPRSRRLRRAGIAMAVVAVVAAIVVAVLFAPRTGDPPGIAALESVVGDVTVTDAAAVTRTATPGTKIRAGDTVRTRGNLGSAVLVHADGTPFALVGNTSLTVSGHDRKRVILHGGTLFAAVMPRSSHLPMLVATPRDDVEVLETSRFWLDATDIQTDLGVSEGRVRLTRRQDGRSVEVRAGGRVVSNAASLLDVEAIPPTPDAWSEDFEDGLPEDWAIGTFAANDLPGGSKGAVRAKRDVSTPEYTVAIATPSEWTRGLVAVHEDTHLHFTLSMQDPGWFNVLILTRTAAGDPPRFAGNYLFDKPVWFGRPGQWGTITIPLSEFRPLPPARDAFADAVPFQVLFSSPDKDRGLTIDRMWITRGGPGGVETKILETSDHEG